MVGGVLATYSVILGFMPRIGFCIIGARLSAPSQPRAILGMKARMTTELAGRPS